MKNPTANTLWLGRWFLKRGLVLTFAAVLSGCFIEITVPAGVQVVSDSGSYQCGAGEVCSIEVVDLLFDETFQALPVDGMEFVGWKIRENSLCGGSLAPCRLLTEGFAGNDDLLAFLDSNEIFHLEPMVQSAGASLSEIETLHNGIARSYTLYTPEAIAQEAPLVMFLHGARGGMRDFIAEGETPADWMDLADQHGFIVVYPNGFSDDDGDGLGDQQSWNDLGGRLSSGDDAGFLLQVIDEIAALRPIDTDKVLIGGRSNGGMMAYRMAIEYSTEFAAIVSFVGNLASDPISSPIATPTPPIMIFGATEDPLVNFGGSNRLRSIPDTVEYFVESTLSDTSLPVTRIQLPDSNPSDGCRIFREGYQNSLGQHSVLYYEGVGSGHYIPDPDFEQSQQNIAARGPVICRDANGVELAYQFFSDVLGDVFIDVPPLAQSMTLSSGANGLFIGQSFFVPVADAFDNAVQSASFPDHGFDSVFSGGSSGSPQALWQNESQRAAIDERLSVGEVELFGMTIGPLNESSPAEFYARWIDLTLAYNSDAAIFIGFPHLQNGPSKDVVSFEQEISEGGEAFFGIVDGLRDAFGDTEIFYINYGKVITQMMAEFEAGELEDIEAPAPSSSVTGETAQKYIFSDNGVGHAGPMALHISALVWANMIYGADIEALADPAFNREDVLRIATDVIAYNRRYLPSEEFE
ncbi:MAG: PHB depolymerase family esterase [Pseudomonadota bacterium]